MTLSELRREAERLRREYNALLDSNADLAACTAAATALAPVEAEINWLDRRTLQVVP